MVTPDEDPMPADLPDKALEAVRRHERLGAVRKHDCSRKGCDREAVVFPPPMCAEHGGLS